MNIMKQLLTLYSLILLIGWSAPSVQAQCNRCCNGFTQTHIRLGATFHGIGSASTPTIGSTIGLVRELHLLPIFQLRSEANVQWQGSEENFWSTNDADYLSVNIPLMLQFRLSRGLYLASGMGLSYLVHTQGGPMPIKRFGVDWVSVLHYHCGGGPIGLEVRYLHRLGSQIDAAPDATTGVPPFNPTSLQAALTVRF